MAEYTHHDLRKAREARNWARWRLAQEIGVSDDTIERWETGKTLPTPEDIDRIGEALGTPEIWHPWMRTNCPSYRKRYPEADDMALPVAITKVFLEARALTEMFEPIMRDAMDGSLDDAGLRQRLTDSIDRMMAAGIDTLGKVKPPST